jgi:hypothetical protein
MQSQHIHVTISVHQKAHVTITTVMHTTTVTVTYMSVPHMHWHAGVALRRTCSRVTSVLNVPSTHMSCMSCTMAHIAHMTVNVYADVPVKGTCAGTTYIHAGQRGLLVKPRVLTLAASLYAQHSDT